MFLCIYETRSEKGILKSTNFGEESMTLATTNAQQQPRTLTVINGNFITPFQQFKQEKELQEIKAEVKKADVQDGEEQLSKESNCAANYGQALLSLQKNNKVAVLMAPPKPVASKSDKEKEGSVGAENAGTVATNISVPSVETGGTEVCGSVASSDTGSSGSCDGGGSSSEAA